MSQDKFTAVNTMIKLISYMKTLTYEIDKCFIDYVISKKDFLIHKNNNLIFLKTCYPIPNIFKMLISQKKQFKRILSSIDSILNDSPMQTTISYV